RDWSSDVCSSDLNHSFGGFIHAHYIDGGTFSSELNNHFIQSTHRRNIPEMSLTHIYGHFTDHFFEIKRIDEMVCRGEKDLANDCVCSDAAIGLGKLVFDHHKAANLIGKE